MTGASPSGRSALDSVGRPAMPSLLPPEELDSTETEEGRSAPAFDRNAGMSFDSRWKSRRWRYREGRRTLRVAAHRGASIAALVDALDSMVADPKVCSASSCFVLATGRRQVVVGPYDLVVQNILR